MAWNRLTPIAPTQQAPANQQGKPKILIGIPHESRFYYEWGIKMLVPLYRPLAWCDKTYTMMRGVPLPVARDQIVEAMLADKSVTHLMWVDSDNVCATPPDVNDAMQMLYACNQPIVSGLYRAKQAVGFNYAAWMDAKADKPGFLPIESWNGNWIQVDVVGTGFCLVQRRVYEAMAKPWYPWSTPAPSEDFNFCLPPETIIYGYEPKAIKDIEIGNKVLTHLGSLRKVADIIERDYDGNLKMITALGTKLRLTPNHPVWIKTKHNNRLGWGMGDVKWSRADEVHKGDWIFMPIPRSNKMAISTFYPRKYIAALKITQDKGEIFYKRTRKAAARIPTKIPITCDLMRLFGYYIAEGSVGSHYQFANFAFGERELEYALDVQNVLKNSFNAQSTVTREPHVIKVNCSSKIVGYILDKLLGHLAKNKKLPRFFYELEDGQLAELIKGYWRGDGNKNGYTATTVSRQLAHELKLSLLKLGILSSVVENKKGFHVDINRHFYKIFSNKIGIGDGEDTSQPPHSFTKINSNHPGYWLKVTDIKDVYYKGKVRNLTVNTNNSYVAEGISVHNCIAARKAGFQINVFTEVKLRHLGELGVNPDGTCSVLQA